MTDEEPVSEAAARLGLQSRGGATDAELAEIERASGQKAPPVTQVMKGRRSPIAERSAFV